MNSRKLIVRFFWTEESFPQLFIPGSGEAVLTLVSLEDRPSLYYSVIKFSYTIPLGEAENIH